MENHYTEEEQYWCTGGNTGTLPDRITPSVINVLEPNEVFVFGSNEDGAHIGGAARVAMERFGAVWGRGEGHQGKCYAIPTMEGLNSTSRAVIRFTSFACNHPNLKFFVTAIGCGIAGYKPEDIAPMFLQATTLKNVYLPISFWKVIIEMIDSPVEVAAAVQNIINLCRYMHINNAPIWNQRTDETIFNSLDRCHMWTLGVLLGVIDKNEIEPQIKALSKELQERILSALRSL